MRRWETARRDLIRTDIPVEQLPCQVVLRTGEPCLDVSFVLHSVQGDIPMLSSGTVLYGNNGDLAGSVAIARDISALKALEQEKEDFVSMLSHDLKSPITAVVGSIDLVREGRLGPVNAEQKEFLESAIESCEEMVEMIDNLLDVHKFEAGKMVLTFRARGPAGHDRQGGEPFPLPGPQGAALPDDLGPAGSPRRHGGPLQVPPVARQHDFQCPQIHP